MPRFFLRNLLKNRRSRWVYSSQAGRKAFSSRLTSPLRTRHPLRELPSRDTFLKGVPEVGRDGPVLDSKAKLIHSAQQPAQVLVFFLCKTQPGVLQSLGTVRPLRYRPPKRSESLKLRKRSAAESVADTLRNGDGTGRRRPLSRGKNIEGSPVRHEPF